MLLSLSPVLFLRPFFFSFCCLDANTGPMKNKLQWLVQQIKDTVMSWIEEKDRILDPKKNNGEDLQSMAVKIQEKASFCVDNCC